MTLSLLSSASNCYIMTLSLLSLSYRVTLSSLSHDTVLKVWRELNSVNTILNACLNACDMPVTCHLLLAMASGAVFSFVCLHNLNHGYGA